MDANKEPDKPAATMLFVPRTSHHRLYTGEETQFYIVSQLKDSKEQEIQHSKY